MAYKDPEQKKAYDAKYRAGHREEAKAYRMSHTKEAGAYNAKYRVEHREEAGARTAKWRKEHPEEVRANNAKYGPKHYIENKGQYRNRDANRRARKKAAFVEDVKREVVFERDIGICYLCDLPVDPNDWHLEHVVPLVAGGEHSYANTAVSCPPCNRSKGAKLLA